MKVLTIIMMMTVVLAQDCRDGKKDSKPPSEVLPVIEMTKNPCFGRCPIYSMTIYNNGKVKYVGQRFTIKLGTFTKQIPMEEVADLVKGFEAIDFWNMPDKYPSQLTDLPKTNIKLYREDKTHKSVSGDTFRPEPLLKMDERLASIADSEDGWSLTKKHPEAKPLPHNFIKNEIITQFTPGTDIPDFVQKRAHYNLAVKKRVAPNLDMWVLTFDTTKIDPSLMLMVLKETPEVKEAEFNKKLSPREH